MRRRYSGALIGGTGPISATLVPPGVVPPFGPSVKSQTLPDTSAASDVSPAAACAWASDGKFSTRQNRGPVGSCFSFFSATFLISTFACAAACEGVSSTPIRPSERAQTRPSRVLRAGSFILVLLAVALLASCQETHEPAPRASSSCA